MFVNYAHRGASAYTPENTIISFDNGLELGANGIELDLQKTKDGKIVIFHDSIIDNKSNGKGKIEDYTYNELLELDFGSWFSEEYKDEKIVLFEEFAKKYLHRKDITFAIELKVVGIEKEVLEIIQKYSNLENIYITSFKYKALTNMRLINDKIKVSWLVEEIDEDKVKKLLEISASQICPNACNVTEKDIQYAISKGLGVRLWGVKNEEIMEKVYKLNIEGMTVNFPDKLKKLMENKNENIYS